MNYLRVEIQDYKGGVLITRVADTLSELVGYGETEDDLSYAMDEAWDDFDVSQTQFFTVIDGKITSMLPSEVITALENEDHEFFDH